MHEQLFQNGRGPSESVFGTDLGSKNSFAELSAKRDAITKDLRRKWSLPDRPNDFTQQGKPSFAVTLRQRATKEAPSLAEKAAQLEEDLGKGSNRSIFPRPLLLSIALMLYAQFLAGVPLTAGLALPIIR